MSDGGTPAAGTVLGARVACAVCGSQVIVTRASADAAVLCHGQPMTPPVPDQNNSPDSE
jgi:hypothetical protein